MLYHISINGEDRGIWVSGSVDDVKMEVTQESGFQTHEPAAEALGLSVGDYLSAVVARKIRWNLIEDYGDGRAFGCIFFGTGEETKGEWSASTDDDGDLTVEYNGARDGATGNDPLVDKHGELIVRLIKDEIVESLS